MKCEAYTLVLTIREVLSTTIKVANKLSIVAKYYACIGATMSKKCIGANNEQNPTKTAERAQFKPTKMQNGNKIGITANISNS